MTNAISNSNGDMALDLPPGQLAAERDEQLVAAAKTGSDDAFAQLQHLYAPRLYSTIIRITKNHEDAEDVLQDTFLRVHLALCNFEGRSSFYSWVTRIAINSALMALRKRRARPEVSFDPPGDGTDDLPHFEIRDSSPNPEQIYHERQQRVMMLRSIRNLQPKLQGTIQIQMANECSMKEIAQTLGISVASVKSRLYRARMQLTSRRNPESSLDERQAASKVQRKGLIPPSLRSREALGMNCNAYR
jgi:RNA polymerase sigma-70 factor (ECF subfamily)